MLHTVRLPHREVALGQGDEVIHADLTVPDAAQALVVFAHGSGSSRRSPRNLEVATALHRASIATLLVDLLTMREEALDRETREYRFDIPRLADRLVSAVDWIGEQPALRSIPVALFGASTGAAAALVAAAARPRVVRAVVSRGGRPDLANDALPTVRAPTLLIVGGRDLEVLRLNEQAMRALHAPVRLDVIPGATHLFEEPGTLAEVSARAIEWIVRYTRRGAPAPS